MNSTLKKLTATVAVAGAVTVGTLGMAGSAFAADNSSGTGGSGGAATAQTGRHPGVRAQVARNAFKIVIDQLGVTKEDLRAALKGGQTISQYAESLGKDPAAIKDALVNAANERIDQAVTDGKIDQAKADTVKGKVGDRVDKFLNRTFGQKTAAAGANA